MYQAPPIEPSSKVRYDCCLDAAMRVIEGRWKSTILCLLYRNGTMRYSELERAIGKITSRILTKQLSELVDDGMVERMVDASGKVKVYYTVTKKGETLMPILVELAKWGAHYELTNIITADSVLCDLDGNMANTGTVKLA